MHPIPHIAARSILIKIRKGILKALKDEASVDEVLIIGGGVDNPVGDFDSSMQILETGLIQDHGIGKIGVSGHPEGSPDINADALAHADALENEFAKKEGLIYISRHNSALRQRKSWSGSAISERQAINCQFALAYQAQLRSKHCSVLPRFPASAHQCALFQNKQKMLPNCSLCKHRSVVVRVG